MTRFKTTDFAAFAALAAIMLATRTHSLSQFVHLPDTSWASFLVAGYAMRSRLGFGALFLLGFAIDVVMIRLLGTPDFCFTPAYAMLIPAYGTLWLAGRWARHALSPTAASLPAFLALVSGATLVAEVLSSGGFYFLGGRFADPTLAGFVLRLVRYFPLTLESTLIWTGVAVVAQALLLRGPAARSNRA
jgi:cell shape-determining protein MreD